jgi:hypothetical protein
MSTTIIKVAFILAMGLLFSFPLMWLMNYVLTPSAMLAVFGIAKMTFWKTFAFSILTGWLFRRN